MEKINIAELLKDCPRGMELDCVSYNNVSFYKISDDKKSIYPIFCYITDKEGNRSSISFTKNGCESKRYGAKCVIFPKGKTTWEGFTPPCKFKDGDIVFYNDTIAIFKEWGDETSFRTYVTKYLCCDSLIDMNVPLFGKSVRREIRFATEKEKEQLFVAIKDNGYKWNPETKTLEKLKFDITTLKPFDSRVLVREGKTDVWQPTFYGFFHKRNKRFYTTMCGTWRMCIPYNEDTKHLTGTTEDCDEFYKTW